LQGGKCLAIERASLCRIFEKPLEEKDMEAGYLPVWGILGIISLEQHHFLCVITEKALVGHFQNKEIFEVT